MPNDGKNKLELYQWGLVLLGKGSGHWEQDDQCPGRDAGEQAGVSQRFKRRRCIIPADGFYEWRKEPNGAKTPMYIRRRDRKPFAFAGLWEVWRSADGTELPTCAIVTGEPNALVKSIHDRMPVILTPEAMRKWLDPAELPPDELLKLLNPYPAEEMEATPVSRAVNNARTDSKECIEAISDPPARDPQRSESTVGNPTNRHCSDRRLPTPLAAGVRGHHVNATPHSPF